MAFLVHFAGSDQPGSTECAVESAHKLIGAWVTAGYDVSVRFFLQDRDGNDVLVIWAHQGKYNDKPGALVGAVYMAEGE